MRLSGLAAASLLLGAATARDVPSNVKDFYHGLMKKTSSCEKPLATGFWSTDDDGPKTDYCGDHVDDFKVIYLQGRNGSLSNMDIDCDGVQGSKAADGRCGYSTDTQSQTSYMDTLASYRTPQKDLDANVHPYVVFGNVGSRKGYTNFDPKAHGIEPLSLMAVVCRDKLIYGVWGDENGNDDAHPMVGEGSLALATACFGKSMNGNNGWDPLDVLFIAFQGKDAVPGKHAKWNASSYAEFEESITDLGDKLVKRIKSTGKGKGGGKSSGTSRLSAGALTVVPVAVALMTMMGAGLV